MTPAVVETPPVALDQTVSLWSRCKSTTNPKQVPVRDVLERIRNPDKRTVDAIARIRAEPDKDKRTELKESTLPAVSFAVRLKNRIRDVPLADKLISHSGFACLDFDHLADLANIKERLKADPHVAAVFVSPSGDGLKVLVRITDPSHYIPCWQSAAAYFKNEYGIKIDKATKDVTRLCFMSYDPDLFIRDGEAEPFAPAETSHQRTERILNEVNCSLRGKKATSAEIADAIRNKMAEPLAPAPAETDSGPRSPILEGERNDRLFREVACSMRGRGATEAEITDALRRKNKELADPVTDAELCLIAKSSTRYDPNVNCTQQGNAMRFVRQHGAVVRYCRPWHTWLVWSGSVWRLDNVAAERLMKETIRTIHVEAANAEDSKAREVLGKWALRSESADNIRNSLYLAQSEIGVHIAPADLDVNPWILNCLNGTLDLKTGKLRPHDPADLCTLQAPVEYDADATLPLWDRFLSDATGGDKELMAFLARWFGYCLTGVTSEEKLAFIHGPEASSKSTAIAAIMSGLGTYAATADFDSFLRKKGDQGPRNDIARLVGKRFVASIEVEDGQRMAEGLIKALTGGDTVTARRLYQEAFEFLVRFKLNLVANDRPKVRAEDRAMWRRILVVPFSHTIPVEKRDPAVKATLRDPAVAGPAILAWAVRGCLEWQRIGLQPPEAVTAATEGYRDAMDGLGRFVADCCVNDPKATVTAAELYAAYTSWCCEVGEFRLPQRTLGLRLEARPGLQRGRIGSGRFWIGLKLRDRDAVSQVTQCSITSLCEELI